MDTLVSLCRRRFCCTPTADMDCLSGNHILMAGADRVPPSQRRGHEPHARIGMSMMRFGHRGRKEKPRLFLPRIARKPALLSMSRLEGETGLKTGAYDQNLIFDVDHLLPPGGWDVGAELRREEVRTAILVLTDRDSVRDSRKDSVGADDYNVKPSRFQITRPCPFGAATCSPAATKHLRHRGFGTRHGARTTATRSSVP